MSFLAFFFYILGPVVKRKRESPGSSAKRPKLTCEYLNERAILILREFLFT